MRSVGIVLIIAGCLGLAYFTFTFNDWHQEQYRAGPMAAIILTNDRVCGSIACSVAVLTGALFLVLGTIDQAFGDFRRQLNEIHTTFTHANQTTIEQNDGVIRNASDLKREREALLREQEPQS